MNYLTSNHHTLIWFWFTVYTMTIIFLIPNNSQKEAALKTVEADNEKALQFASKMILRTILIIPMIFLLKNTV